MRHLDIEKIYKLLINQKIYKTGVFNDIFVGNIYTCIKDFCKNYLKTSVHDFFNILEHAHPIQKKINFLSNNSVSISNINNALTINNLNSYINIDVNKKALNAHIDVIKEENISSKLIKSIFTKHIRENINSLIISMLLIRQIILINIPPNIHMSLPISIFHNFSSMYLISSNYILINVGENSCINFYQINNNAINCINSNIIHMVLNKNVKIEFTNIQNDENLSYSFQHVIVEQMYNSQFIFNNICIKGYLSLNNIHIYQNMSYSSFFTNWVTIGHINQKIYDIVNVNHNSDYGTSLEKFKGIYYDNSSRILENTVKILEKTEYIKSHQISENLILSSNAYIRILPAMKIYSDNIQCTHGVVIDKISKNILFYMCSRGLNKEIACNIIMISFIKDMLNKITDQQIKKHTWKYVKNKLLNIFI